MRLLMAATVAALLFFAGPARAELQVSIVTFGPGEAVYERFGHVAIRVQDPARGVDECFDWGNFDFDTPGFIFRFVKGDLNYWMEGGKPGQRMIDFYAREWDRTIVEQTLNLTPQQTESLVRALLNNDTDANRYYRYDYYKDNCATRVRDAIDAATNGVVRASLRQTTPNSYRWHTRRLMPVGGVNKLCETLADMVGGPRIDLPLSEWDACFLPTTLADEFDTVRIPTADGSTVPLVRERRVLHTTTTPANAEPSQPWNPIRWTLPASLVGSALLLLLAWRGWRISFRLLASAWELWVLFAALFMPTIILFTWHWVVAWNQNLLQFTPLSILVLVSLWIRRWRRPVRWAAAAAVALSAIGALMTISPLSIQHNAPAVALALPMHLAVMLGQFRLDRPRSADEEGSPAQERTPAP